MRLNGSRLNRVCDAAKKGSVATSGKLLQTYDGRAKSRLSGKLVVPILRHAEFLQRVE
jgi:hypothetical protein